MRRNLLARGDHTAGADGHRGGRGHAVEMRGQGSTPGPRGVQPQRCSSAPVWETGSDPKSAGLNPSGFPPSPPSHHQLYESSPSSMPRSSQPATVSCANPAPRPRRPRRPPSPACCVSAGRRKSERHRSLTLPPWFYAPTRLQNAVRLHTRATLPAIRCRALRCPPD